MMLVRPSLSDTTVQLPAIAAAPRSHRLLAQRVTGVGSEYDAELLVLLHWRLRLMATLACGLYAYFVCVWALRPPAYQFGHFSARDWLFLLLNHATFAWEAIAAALLWSRTDMSLRRLRLLELTVLGLPFLHQCVHAFEPLFLAHALTQSIQAGADPQASARAHVLTWFVLIIGYGVLIPNSWRRCSTYVVLMAATALGLNVSAAAGGGVLSHPWVVRYVAELGVWLALALVLATYNARRIDVMRAEAIAARRLGQYRLLRRLGSGGMGDVFLAEHAFLKRPCAIKTIRPERAGAPGMLARFEREVQATATLTHPNTIQIYDYGHAEDGTFYYAMEYLPGFTFEELVHRHGPLPPGRAVYLLRQVASALHEAHAIGLIHRDVKPGNVIVCERGGLSDTAKLLDFGLVRQSLPEHADVTVTMAGMAVGTPAYMSPEQAAGCGELDARSDIYCLGAVAYFLLTGQPPFVRDSAMRTVAAHLLEPLPALSGVRADLPADLQAVVHRCLAKEPAQRFPECREIEAALAACACAVDWGPAQASAWWATRRPGAAAPELPRCQPTGKAHAPAHITQTPRA